MKKGLLMIALVLLIVLALNTDAMAHRQSRVFLDFGFFFPITPYPVAPPVYSHYPSYYYPYAYTYPQPYRYWAPGHWVLERRAPGIRHRIWVPGRWVYR
ncbi:MAG: hypothetical protein HY730_06235 [Candidatus Tectomicrobia bacterium]|uniref:Uncharacterized protein n=1 Tax=Tectimicrobiota bacterium TaxID=2528274 RepID=A0A933GLU0_UNCTE|nr:hypothetical protein [Candidatus Tectomicrobia bacterium]